MTGRCGRPFLSVDHASRGRSERTTIQYSNSEPIFLLPFPGNDAVIWKCANNATTGLRSSSANIDQESCKTAQNLNAWACSDDRGHRPGWDLWILLAPRPCIRTPATIHPACWLMVQLIRTAGLGAPVAKAEHCILRSWFGNPSRYGIITPSLEDACILSLLNLLVRRNRRDIQQSSTIWFTCLGSISHIAISGMQRPLVQCGVKNPCRRERLVAKMIDSTNRDMLTCLGKSST